MVRIKDLVDRRWLWLAAFALFAALAVPITVSFDGILYLQSSRHLFGDFALDGYQWTREPLYAMILRAIRITGGQLPSGSSSCRPQQQRLPRGS